MKRIILSFIFMFSLTSFLLAQNYTIVSSAGTSPDYAIFDTTATLLLTTGGSAISATQTIPFPFKFYGSDVTTYKAATDGYITFDVTNTSSNGSNVALPNASAPAWSIFAFWDDWELNSVAGGTPDAITINTYGTAPNRVHVIQWRSITRAGGTASSDWAYFAIRLFEDNHFDVVLNGANYNSTSATIGCQDISKSLASSVSGSPNIAYPSLDYTSNADDQVYSFYYVDKAYDVKITSTSWSDVIYQNDCISGTLVNVGTETITGFDYVWSINGEVNRRKYTGLNIPTGGSYSFSNGYPVALSPGSTANISMVIESLNGSQVDGNPSDNEFASVSNVFSGDMTSEHYVLLEEFTTAPCGYCPDGGLVVESIASTNARVIPVGIHAGYLTDAMTISEHSTLATRMANGAPTACIDRVLFDGETRIGHSRNVWASHTSQRLAEATPVCVSMSNTYNSTTRVIDANIDITLLDNLPEGDYRVNLYVLEDSVIGSGSGYDQTNYYNTTSGHPYNGAGNPIVGYIHRHVLRALPTTTWGDASILSSQPAAGSYQASYSYTLPASNNANRIHLVAFVSQYDASDDTKMTVFNSIENRLNDSETNSCAADASRNSCPTTFTPTGIEENVLSDEDANLQLYPNPVNDVLNVSIMFENPTEVVMNVYDSKGNLVVTSGMMQSFSGVNNYFVNTTELASGAYHLAVRSNSNVLYNKTFIVE